MKKILTLLFISLAVPSYSQMNLPVLSPEGKIIQEIGYTSFTIRYGRPAARGRKIFGELVPYGKHWRTGGGKCTTLQFDQPVTIGGKEIKAGIYALVTIPEKNQWTILLNSDTSKIFGASQDEYNQKTEVARFMTPTEKAKRFYESLSFDLDVVNNNGELFVSWENTTVHFTIITNSNKKAREEINQTLAKNPDNADNLSYAAYYLNMNNESAELLLPYIDNALKIREDWWYYEIKADLLLKLNRLEEARQVLQQAINFITKVKPVDWELIVKGYKEKLLTIKK